MPRRRPGPALPSSLGKRQSSWALDARAQPCVTARTRDAEMLQRLRSSLRWVPAGGSPIVPLSPATPNCSPGLSGPVVRHVSLLCHVLPRSRSFVMACLPRAAATLARQVPAWQRARGARTSKPRGTHSGRGRGFLREGATRLPGITARHHGSRGDAGWWWWQDWGLMAGDSEVRGTRRLPQRTRIGRLQVAAEVATTGFVDRDNTWVLASPSPGTQELTGVSTGQFWGHPGDHH